MHCIMVIIAGNGISDLSSNPVSITLHTNAREKGMNPSSYS